MNFEDLTSQTSGLSQKYAHSKSPLPVNPQKSMAKLSKEPTRTVFPRPVSTRPPLTRQPEWLQNKTQRMREETMLHNRICVVAEVHHSTNYIPLVMEQQSVEEPNIEQQSVEDQSLNSSQLKNQSLNNSQLKNQSLNSSYLKNQTLNSSQLKNQTLNSSQLKNQSMNSNQLKNQSLNSSHQVI